MELNILKQDVIINDKIFTQSAEHSIENDFTLPDYYPEISKILKCRVTPRISSTGINGQTLSVDGNISVNLIYCSPDDEIFGFEQILPFSKVFPIDSDCTDAHADCFVKCEYINCRALGERRIEVRGAIGIYAKVIKKHITKAIADIDCNDIIVRRGLVPATSPIGCGEKSMVIEEELELGSGQPSIRNILKYDIKVVNKECKIISGKVVVKGEMGIFILYCAVSGGGAQVYRNMIPFSGIVDIDGITDECECTAKTCVAMAEIKPRTSASGETRSFLLNSKLNFTASACCNDDLPVVLDAYSTRYNADIECKEIMVEKIFKTINDSFVCKKNIEVSSDGISSVIDIWCDSHIINSCVNNCRLIIQGNMQVCILALNSKGTPEYIERSIEFNYECPVDSNEKEINVKAEVIANNVSFTLLSEREIEICAEMCVNACIYIPSTIKVVTNVNVDEKNIKSRSTDSALIIYYADAGECIWDIARKYNSSPAEISEINCIEDDVLIAKKTLLIPVK